MRCAVPPCCAPAGLGVSPKRDGRRGVHAGANRASRPLFITTHYHSLLVRITPHYYSLVILAPAPGPPPRSLCRRVSVLIRVHAPAQQEYPALLAAVLCGSAACTARSARVGTGRAGLRMEGRKACFLPAERCRALSTPPLTGVCSTGISAGISAALCLRAQQAGARLAALSGGARQPRPACPGHARVFFCPAPFVSPQKEPASAVAVLRSAGRVHRQGQAPFTHRLMFLELKTVLK